MDKKTCPLKGAEKQGLDNNPGGSDRGVALVRDADLGKEDMQAVYEDVSARMKNEDQFRQTIAGLDTKVDR